MHRNRRMVYLKYVSESQITFVKLLWKCNLLYCLSWILFRKYVVENHLTDCFDWLSFVFRKTTIVFTFFFTQQICKEFGFFKTQTLSETIIGNKDILRVNHQHKGIGNLQILWGISTSTKGWWLGSIVIFSLFNSIFVSTLVVDLPLKISP